MPFSSVHRADPGLLRLDLPVQLIDVIRDRNKHTLCQYIILPPVQLLSEPHILFYNIKRPFCLYAAVHPELCTVITQDALQVLFPLFLFGL